MAVAGRRHPRPLPHAARQLPHVAPDPRAGRPPPRARDHGSGRRHGKPEPHRLRVNGPPPEVREFGDPEEEAEAVGGWIAEQIDGGVRPHEIGVFVRSPGELARARSAAERAGLPHRLLDDALEPAPDHLSISTMHLAKGLEFRVVAVMACDDEVVPLQERVEAVGDTGDLQEVYDTERQLLYVACTRARDRLWVSVVEPASEFLEDMG